MALGVWLVVRAGWLCEHDKNDSLYVTSEYENASKSSCSWLVHTYFSYADFYLGIDCAEPLHCKVCYLTFTFTLKMSPVSLTGMYVLFSHTVAKNNNSFIPRPPLLAGQAEGYMVVV